MTGFGEASSHREGVHYFLEVRSLNGKYFKASIRMPEELQGLEPEMETELRRRLTRGTITLVCKTSDSSAAAAYTINHEAIERYMEQLRRSRGVADGSARMDVSSLLSLPGVLQPPSDEEERLQRARQAFSGLLEKACAGLLATREREGRLLVADLMHHHELIMRNLSRVAELAPGVVREYQKRLQTRIESLLQDAKVRVEPVDLLREVAVYAEKSDIAEEVARLSGHLAHFKDLLAESDGRPIGRTLDFLSQEMLREANTIASKSGDAEISRAVVEIKGAIDRIKEQVQNVE
ncbi:MAG: YicC/YloC family endoribonuclease [Planctomycetota bacterium]|nr:YicC/YloC family endoribonuclease [Planctomycetota bacterium]